MSISSNAQTYIDDLITEGQQEVLSLEKFYDTMLSADADNPLHIIRIPVYDFFTRYHNQLKNSIQYYNLSSRLFYQPKAVSLELYDTTELWLSLLRVNNMKNITEFQEPVIKVYNPVDVKELINIFFKREKKV